MWSPWLYTYVREPDAGVACGALHDRATRLERAATLCCQHDAESCAIFY